MTHKTPRTKYYMGGNSNRGDAFMNSFQPRTLENAVIEAVRFSNRFKFTAHDVVEDINQLYPNCQPVQKGLVNALSVAMILETRSNYTCIEENKDKRWNVFIDNFNLEQYRKLRIGFLS